MYVLCVDNVSVSIQSLIGNVCHCGTVLQYAFIAFLPALLLLPDRTFKYRTTIQFPNIFVSGY
jgi:hypothetical protein